MWVVNSTRRDSLKKEYGQDPFKKDIAVDAGVGIRYDLDYFVLRLDWGFALHYPYDAPSRKFKDIQCINFAIGYPF